MVCTSFQGLSYSACSIKRFKPNNFKIQFTRAEIFLTVTFEHVVTLEVKYME